MTKPVIVQNLEDVATFGRNDASLLGQLDYWLKKAAGGKSRHIVRISGHAWVAKSRASLCEETCLTPKQLRSALERLTKAGVLISKPHLYENKVTSHFRIDESRRDQLVQISQAQEVYNDNAPQGQIDCAPQGQILYTETLVETKKDYGSTAVDQLSGKNKKVSVLNVGEGATPLATVIPDTASTIGEVIDLWKKAWSDTHEGYLPLFTSAQIGQIKLIMVRSGFDKPGILIDWTIRHWQVFTVFAVSDQGAFNTPGLPEPGFLLKYIQSAVAAYNGSQVPLKQPQWHTPKAITPVEPVVVKEIAPEDKMATLEEVQKLLTEMGVLPGD